MVAGLSRAWAGSLGGLLQTRNGAAAGGKPSGHKGTQNWTLNSTLRSSAFAIDFNYRYSVSDSMQYNALRGNKPLF